MSERVHGYDVLEKCIKDILSLIKPAEDDRNKRLSAIQELENSIQSVAAFRGAAAKPFGSFLSNLYSKSGDLDLSVQIVNSSNLRISKNKKQNILRELRRALQIRGVARYMEFIPHARVPVLQYVSNHFGISCDLSIDNYPGRIKSRIFYWISTLDERFGDMVLLIKEWAKAQNINDPKTGTLNSYSLCLLVLFHFQICEPAILPPLKDIYEGNITDMTLYNEEHIDEVCTANIAKFQSQNKEQRNESSLCHLLATFFYKFRHINALSSDVISTYTGQFEQIQDNPSWTAKSYSLFVEDPVERPDNAARAVGVKGLLQIVSAFNDANHKFASLEHIDRTDLLAMLCTSVVCSNLGGRIVANSYTNTPQRTHQHTRSFGRVAAIPSDNQFHNGARRFTGSRPVHSPRHVHTTGRQTGQPGQYQHHVPPQVHTTGRQTGLPGQYQHYVPPQVHTTGCQTGLPGQYQHYVPPQVHTTGRQTGLPGQYQHHVPPQVHTNTTGRQTAGQRGLYQNHNTSGYQTAGLHQNQSQPQVHNTWIQAAGPYNNGKHPHVYTTGLQPAGPYQNHSHPQVNTSGLQTQGLYQNYYNHPRLYNTGPQTEGSYQNQQGRKYTPGRQTKRNGVTVRYEPAVTGLKNGLARDSQSQAYSSGQHVKRATNIY